LFLWKGSRKELKFMREQCVDCEEEAELLETGQCSQSCAVNQVPTLPLVLFFFSVTFAVVALFYSAMVYTYILPVQLSSDVANANHIALASNPILYDALYGLLVASCVVSAAVLAAYLMQDKPLYREVMSRGAVVGVLASLFMAPFLSTAMILVPVGLFILLVSVGMELRARKGRPLVQLNTLAIGTIPLFVISIAALLKIIEMLGFAGLHL
jgi:hypothetical protein